MNCKWAEGHLSACLDGTLDPAVRDEVSVHVEGCTHCSGILQEYRYFDGLMGELPRYEPSDDLRERIFGSPEFASILRSLDTDPTETATPTRHPITSRPFILSRPIAIKRERPAHDRALTPLPIPLPTPPSAQGEPASGSDRGAQPRHGGAPPWGRLALSAAAAVVLLLGSGLLIKQGMPHSGTASKPGISGVARPNDRPLAAGARVVYERGGALWSAPEQGRGLAQQLTPAGVTVGAGWAVVPIQNGTGGDHVAYVDLKTGAVHVVRSDDQRDLVVGHTTAGSLNASFWAGDEGRSILAGLAWSPDGTQLAYLADTGNSSHTTLMIVHAEGTGASAVPAAAGASSAMAVWSPDGQRIAFVQAGAAGQTVWDYNAATQQMRQLSGARDAASAAAQVRALGWLPQPGEPMVTWALGDPAAGTYTDLFVRDVLQDGQPQRLTPAGASFTAADYTPNRNGGLWLLGDGKTLYTVSARYPGVAQLATVAGGVRAVSWAPDGSAAAFINAAGELRIWVRSSFQQVATGVAAQPGLTWSLDGSALAFVAGAQPSIVRLSAGGYGAATAVSGVSGATALAWAPDGQRLALATPAGVALVSPDGTSVIQVDAHPADGGLIWSVAR
jgi:Tol biopolymer transport system component